MKKQMNLTFSCNFYVLTLVLFSLFFKSNLVAQDKVDYLFDNNCLPMAKKNRYVRGDSRFLNDSTKRTERWFSWDKISKDYRKLINNKQLKEIAYQRMNSSEYTPLTCKEPSSCLAFKAYCTAQVSSEGIKEELKEWEDRVADCSSQKYISTFPEHCQRDFDKSLSYLTYHANELADINGEKSPEVALFFKEAAKTFSQYKNNLSELLESFNESQKQLKQNKELAVKKLNTAKAIKDCQDLVNKDEHDVKGRNISLNILSGMSCTNLSSTEQAVSEDLLKSLKGINKYSSVKVIAPKLNTIAIEKSSKALWASFESFFNQNNKALTEKRAIDLICKQKSEFPNLQVSEDLSSICSDEFKKKLSKSFQDYLKLKERNPIKPVSQESLAREIETQFNPIIKTINKSCSDAKKEYEKNESLYQCSSFILNQEKIAKYLKVKNKVDPVNVPDDLAIINRSEKGMSEAKCNRILDAKFKQHKRSQAKAYSVSTPAYNSMLKSRVGHLMITDRFQQKVGLASHDWVYKKCLKGKGKAFNEVTLQDVDHGLNDVLNLSFKELKDTAIESKSDGDKYDQVKDYLKNNPLSVAQLLDKNPEKEYAHALCSFIRDINLSDYRKQWVERGTIAVGVVGGVALSMTGIGTPAGAALIATVGAATTVEFINISKEIELEKKDLQSLKQSAVTFQTDFDKAFRDINSKKTNIAGLKKDRKLVAVLGALDILGSGGFRLIKNYFKTTRGIRAGRILGTTAEVLDKSSAIKLGKKLALNIESIYSTSSKKLKKVLKKLDHQELLELAAIYSKLDSSSKKVFLKSLSSLDSKTKLLKVINYVSSNIDELLIGKSIDYRKVASFIRETGRKKLADGTFLDDIIPDKEVIKLSKPQLTKEVADVSLQNGGEELSKTYFKKRADKYVKNFIENKQVAKLYNKISFSNEQKDVLFSHLSFGDPHLGKKMMSILSDSAIKRKSFLNKLKKTGCLDVLYNSRCQKLVSKLIIESSQSPINEHKLYKEWLLKQSDDIKLVFSSKDLKGADLYLASKSISKNTKVKDVENLKDFINYASTLSEKNRVEAFESLHLIAEGKKVPKSRILNRYKKRQLIFDGYEKYFGAVSRVNSVRLKKIARNRGVEPTKANLNKIATEESKRLRAKFVSKFNACKAGNAKGVQASNLKRFLKFNTASSLAFTVGSYMWIMGSDDEEKVVVDKDGNIQQGKPDKNYERFVGILGYELVASYIFSKFPALIMGSPGSNLALNAAKDYGIGSGADYINTRIYGSIFGVNESESKKKLAKLLSDPTKKEALEHLTEYVDKKMKKPEMKKVVEDLKSEFSLFTNTLEAEDEVGYDYLMDNFSAGELGSSDILMESFEESLNEYEYDQKAGKYPISKYISELTNGATKVSTANDLFYYNLAYNIPSSGKRIFMYNTISNRLCMGRWGEVLTFTAIDKFISNAAYWGGRKLVVGD